MVQTVTSTQALKTIVCFSIISKVVLVLIDDMPTYFLITNSKSLTAGAWIANNSANNANAKKIVCTSPILLDDSVVVI